MSYNPIFEVAIFQLHDLAKHIKNPKFWKKIFLNYSQILLSPLVDDHQPTYLTNLRKKKNTQTHTHFKIPKKEPNLSYEAFRGC
jgi:hypothetical protein